MEISTLHRPSGAVKSYGKILQYPDGSYDIVAADRAIFGIKGEELSKAPPKVKKQQKKEQPDADDLERARRRARANVRRLALANDFKWFVTLTLDGSKIDRYDDKVVVRKLSQWLSNRVKRNGLRYVLVPEHHKDGAIHFHGFFSDSLKAVESGHTDKKGHMIFNLPQWDWGYTTAIELYGDYHAAVGYVCKYIGKDAEKIGGRWYYSGGQLEKPVEKFVDISCRDLMEQYKDGAWMKKTPVGCFAGVNGVRERNVQ